MTDRSERTHTETTTEARQGETGRTILYVLIGGLLLAALYFAGTQIWSQSEDTEPAAEVEGGEVVDPDLDAPAIAPEGETPANEPAG